jgi:rhodanese-related sulfurtransferase
MLAQAGFKNAYTVVDGFEGDREKDPASQNYGKRTVNGWKNAGLP